MQLQTISSHSLAQYPQDSARVVFSLNSQDHIIGAAHVPASPPHSWAYLLVTATPKPPINAAIARRTARTPLHGQHFVILVPVALPTLLGFYDTTQGTIPESSGYRSLVGALWTSLLVASVLGMWAPLRYVPVLMMQVIYKSLWLLLYAMPALRRKKPVPLGFTISFAAIVLLWPWLIPWHLLIRE